jgi:predicted nucleotidyltransferase component of viral defense system
MNNAIETMLRKYDCQTERDYVNALKEIFQEIALLGLWRSKFFEKAAFYGGTALRILYGLDRFSEDMDFSLLQTDRNFTLDKYNEAIASELNSFGFEVEVHKKLKNTETNIESAFIKANTLKQLISIEISADITQYIHHMNSIKIKMEVDTDPPGKFSTEVKRLLLPIPFTVLTLTQEDLFASKIHAILCRQWQLRIKGRDWYDFYWYISRSIPINLTHLEARLVQSGHWDHLEKLTHERLLNLLYNKIELVDFALAKKDVIDFLKDKATLDLWSKEFFYELTKKTKILELNVS